MFLQIIQLIALNCDVINGWPRSERSVVCHSQVTSLGSIESERSSGLTDGRRGEACVFLPRKRQMMERGKSRERGRERESYEKEARLGVTSLASIKTLYAESLGTALGIGRNGVSYWARNKWENQGYSIDRRYHHLAIFMMQNFYLNLGWIWHFWRRLWRKIEFQLTLSVRFDPSLVSDLHWIAPKCRQKCQIHINQFCINYILVACVMQCNLF